MNVELCLIFLKLSLCFAFRGDEVAYIKPSPDDRCPTRSCFTLSQFAVVVQSKLNYSVLMFLPGNHCLGSDLFITNISEFSMVSKNSSLHLNITCRQNANFIFNKISNMSIKGLKFCGCSLRISSSDQLRIEDSTFLGQEGSETALEIIDTSASATNSYFAFNMVGSSRGPIQVLVYKEQEYPDLSVITNVGGAIIANQSNISIIRSEFEGNCAAVGGAIFATMGSNVTIINSTFVNNSVNSSTSITRGGVLYSEIGRNSVTKASVVLFGNNFHNNTASFNPEILKNYKDPIAQGGVLAPVPYTQP